MQALQPAFLRCDAAGCVSEKGALALRAGALQLGQPAESQLPCAQASLPHEGPALTLAAVHLDNGRCAVCTSLLTARIAG